MEEARRQSEDNEAEFRSVLMQQQAAWNSHFDAERAKYEGEIEAVKQQHANATNEALTAQAEALREQWQTELARQRDLLENASMREREGRLAAIQDIEAKLGALEAATRDHRLYKEASNKVLRLTSASFDLTKVLERNEPFADALQALLDAAANDEMIRLSVDVIPEALAEDGLPTTAELQDRFVRVKKSCARAALVTPEGGMWYHLMSSIYATFYVMPKGLVEGDGVFEVLARADYYMSRGALNEALVEMRALERGSWPQKLASDWCDLVEKRLVVEMAVTSIQTYITMLTTTLQ